MKKKWLTLIFVAVLCMRSSGQYAIRNVSIIPMSRDTVLKDQTIVVEKGLIKTIGPSSKVRINKSLAVIDGTGKYIIPGLMDMHTHFFADAGGQPDTWAKELKLMLANGITTARLMTGHPSYLDLKKKIASGSMTGPALFVASPQLAGKWAWSEDFKNFEVVDTPEKAVAAVRKFKNDGFDEIKITFMISRPVYKAIIETAHEVNIKVTGHVGPLVKLPTALEARQQVEHMDQFIEMLLPDSSINHGQSVSDFNLYSKDAWATIPYLDESKIPSLATQVKNSGIYVTPTNYFTISCFGDLPSDQEIVDMQDYEFIPKKLREEKWKYRKSYISKMAAEESRARFVSIRKKMVHELWKAGVPLMAGSDSPEYFIVAGFSLHDELRAMVDAGLSTFAALQTATVNPASYLNILHKKGTVESGKVADMLLLEKNPLDDINHSRSILNVFNGTRSYNAAALKEMLDDARAIGR